MTNISKARQSLFTLVEAAARGEKVAFTHKGQRFYIVAEETPSKLARLKPLDILPPGTSIADTDQALSDLAAQNAAEWESKQ
ncbi:MAG: hypothetical protein HYX27_20270 [Acidobacteria bacterium]|nr:hypothetical protein [Acidobacteriota bacterium]